MPEINRRIFGAMPDGTLVHLFELQSDTGCKVSLLEYGAAITSVSLPNQHGDHAELCIGYDDLEHYINDKSSIGVTVGRYANRIRNSTFVINGKTHHLSANIPPHHIHGGSLGFGKTLWAGTEFEAPDHVGVQFCCTSLDGDGGYPGNMDIYVIYSLSNDNLLSIEYEAICDADTYVNLTNHAYFNLSDDPTVLDHEVSIESDTITPLDKDLIVTGEFQSTIGTPFDFRELLPIRKGLEIPSEQIDIAGGYDINFVLGDDHGSMRQAATVLSPSSGRRLIVRTTQPCIQFYTGNNLKGVPSRNQQSLPKFGGFCLEAQDYPNGPNVDVFPTNYLKAGNQYCQRIEYQFLNESN
jgi:aldose 1-epimerase